MSQEDPGECRLAFIFGVTTCDQARLENNYFHVNEYCRDGTSECGGYSATIRINVTERNVKSVGIDKLDNGALCRLTIVFQNGTKKLMKLRDRTNGRMIETAGEYYPFIILEGFVTEVKLEEIRTIREVSFSIEAGSWILGDGIG